MASPISKVCFAIWEPAQFGGEYEPQDGNELTLHKRYAPYRETSAA